mgnify:CR=1 FL=1
MRRAVLRAPRRLALEDGPLPAPGPGEVLVRVRAALTCGTDLKTYRRGHARLGPGPFGHEAAGDVVAVGPGVAQVRPGDAVMYVPTAGCGQCAACRRGAENHCPRLFQDIVLGAYAEHVLVTPPVAARHLFPKPPELRYTEAAFLEPLACVLHGWRRLGVLEGSAGSGGSAGGPSVAVVGAGPIAFLFLLTGLRLGLRPAVVARRRDRLVLAAALGGRPVDASGDVDGAQEAVRRGLKEALGEAPDVVVEATGSAAVWTAAPAWVRSGGRVLLFGGLAPGARATFDAARLHYGEVDLVSAFHYTSDDVTEARRWLAERRIDVGPLVTAVRPLEEIVEVFEELDRGAHLKVAIVPDGAAPLAGEPPWP